MNTTSQRWLGAGKILVLDVSAKVLCSERGDAILQVTDATLAGQNSVVERHLTCPVCGVYNAL